MNKMHKVGKVGTHSHLDMQAKGEGSTKYIITLRTIAVGGQLLMHTPQFTNDVNSPERGRVSERPGKYLTSGA